jgi:hypothetical protein
MHDIISSVSHVRAMQSCATVTTVLASARTAKVQRIEIASHYVLWVGER